MNPVRVPDVVADQPLQPRVTVEATAVLPELYEPRPDELRLRADGDRVLHGIVRVWDKVITRKHGTPFGVARTPSRVPRAGQNRKRDVAERRERQRASCGTP